MFSLNERVYNIRVHVEPTLQQLPITRPLEGFSQWFHGTYTFSSHRFCKDMQEYSYLDSTLS